MEQQPSKPKFNIEPLGAQHNRAAFSCGVDPLDKYLQTQASQDLKKNLASSTSLHLIEPPSQAITRRLPTLCDLTEFRGNCAKADANADVPATQIGRLARSSALHGQGTGEILLTDALKRSLANSKYIASWTAIVDAKDANAIAFYKKYGFMELPATPERLFLPMEPIARLF